MLTHKSNTAVFGLVMMALLILHFFVTAIPSLFFIIIILIYVGIVVWGSSQINSNYHIKTICKAAQNNKNEIAITFDDGPDAAVTPIVLDILKKHNLRATFFCIGKKIDGNENILQRIFTEGHIVANHSYSHSYFIDFFGTKKIKEEIVSTNSDIEKIINKKIQFFRPPYGVTTPNIAKAVESLQLKTIGWDVRSMDAVEKNEDKIVARVTSQLKSGSIILFHDTNARIASVLEQTIEHCNKNGFIIVPLDKLLNTNPYA